MTWANGTARIQSVIISHRAYSFLLVTYKKIKSQECEQEADGSKESDFIMIDSGNMSSLIDEAFEEWKKERGRSSDLPSDLYEPKFKFEWINNMNSTKKNECFLESDLIGRHDFFCLLESPWIPELGSLVEKINHKMKEDRRIYTEELIGVPCAATDFEIGGEYFVGKEKPWFERENSHPIELDSRQVHALMFIDLKKGLINKGRRISLPDFLNVLVDPKNDESDTARPCLLPDTKKSIKGFFLGYGIYELIFLLENRGLEDLFTSVAEIRKCFNKRLETFSGAIARGTSTMVFMLRRSMIGQDENLPLETESVNYSVIVSTETGKDIDVSDEIRKRGENVGINIDVFDRQGHYDLIASFNEKSFSNACLLMASIWESPGVLGTSTIIKIDEKLIAEKMRGRKL